MVERVNRRDQIIEVAAEMFITNGYSATSIRQIAEQVGCTEAAIYYHFKEGKRALLQEVVEAHSPDFMGVLDECRDCQTMAEFIICYGQGMAAFANDRGQAQMRWIITEFPKLTEDEKAFIHSRHLSFHNETARMLAHFTSSTEFADHLAWMLLCTALGYEQLFRSMELQDQIAFQPEQLIMLLSKILTHTD